MEQSIGEKFGEKFYGVFTYDYTINVFSIIHIPNCKPKIIEKQCRTIDIFPTIAEIIKTTSIYRFKKYSGRKFIPVDRKKLIQKIEKFL